MWRKVAWGVGILVAALLLGALVVWPLVDGELMKIPMTDGLAALRRGNLPAVRACFTPNAVAFSRDREMPITQLLDAYASEIEGDKGTGSYRFGGYTHLLKQGNTALADFTVYYYLNDDDVPYRNVPIKRTGKVMLVRDGFFSWKIARIGSDEPELAVLLRAMDL